MATAVPHEGDLLLRALSADGTVGVRAIAGADLAREAATRQGASPLAAAALGRTLLGTLLLGLVVMLVLPPMRLPGDLMMSGAVGLAVT